MLRQANDADVSLYLVRVSNGFGGRMMSIRKQIEQDLRRNGSELLKLRRLWFYLPALFARELKQPLVVYRAIARSVHGDLISRVYAHEVLGLWGSNGRPGLQRHVPTGWIDAN